MINDLSCKRYIGDGVYAGFDGYQIMLSTLEGMRIALEPAVMQSLIAYVARLRETIDATEPAEDQSKYDALPAQI